MFRNNLKSIIKKYVAEFALIFVSVLLAFSLTEWSNNKGEKISQNKLLTEIKNGINSDLQDFEANLKMHKISKSGVRALRNWATNKQYNSDSLSLYYYLIFRNYSPIINKTGYESLKETNLKTVTNDSLRFQIIKLYDYHYNILEQIEDKNEEMQDFKTYFAPTNKILAKYLVFDDKGNLKNISEQHLTDTERKEILSYLWRMELTKQFKILHLQQIINEIKKLDNKLGEELKR